MARKAARTGDPGGADDGKLRIVPLTGETWDALAALFEEGGDPRWCWCAFYRQRGLDWTNSTPDTNRRLLRDRVDAGPRAPGLVALDPERRAVGWVSVGPREEYERLEHAKVLARIDDTPVWSIVCFVVARRARGQGVARALLDGAVAWAEQNGATMLEAYPADPGEGRIPAAEAFKGTLPMFTAAGFEVATIRRANRKTRPRPIVRRAVGARKP